jgi:hypothetical protein
MTLTQVNTDTEYRICEICGKFSLVYTSIRDRDAKEYIPGWRCLACESEFTGDPVETTLIDETDVTTGTYYEVLKTRNLCNIVFQYKLIAGVDNIIELQFWGTVYIEAEESTDDDWTNITEFLTEEETLSITNDSLQDLAITDSNVALAKVKIKYIVTASSPDNTIKVGWNSDK